MQNSSWYSTTQRPEAAKQRLFCLPHAGGGAAIYHRWARRLSESIEMVAIKLPGREDRFSEAPFDNLDMLASQIVHEIDSLLDLPFCMFGHSMGAAIGYRMCVQLMRQKKTLPRNLFVSSCRAPGTWRDNDPLHRHDDESMLRGLLARYGSAISQDPDAGYPTSRYPAEPGELELMRLLANTIRADLKMLETYEHDDPSPIDCPILALGGADDPVVNLAALQRWQSLTSAKFATRIFPGGHFYLRDQEVAVVQTIQNRMATMV